MQAVDHPYLVVHSTTTATSSAGNSAGKDGGWTGRGGADNVTGGSSVNMALLLEDAPAALCSVCRDCAEDPVVREAISTL